MTRQLGGWWRLWIVLTLIYGCAVAAFTWISWPEVSRIPHDPAFLKQMSSDAVLILERPKNLSELERALVEADRAKNTEFARKLAQQIVRLRESPKWQQDPMVLEMPNGHEFQVAGDTPKDLAGVVGKEYVRVLQSVASEKKLRSLGAAVLAWLVPSAFVCALGLAVAWIIRGFRGARREP